ncbi:YqgQ family protein [Planococcus salinus]|uniref:DUF910 family protein n=1 Tax=Planococcus salinus TaxID=1848460 RepID=A0A3M8PBN9_9BACL|nr:YqgQ family protein [Planococcus salinus]RNF41053.1 DUF910 family protein [Planococcus salinus]
MKNLFDVMQLLKKYGTVIYTGDKQADLEMMEDEIRELYQLQFITAKEFASALLIIRGRKEDLS